MLESLSTRATLSTWRRRTSEHASSGGLLARALVVMLVSWPSTLDLACAGQQRVAEDGASAWIEFGPSEAAADKWLGRERALCVVSARSSGGAAAPVPSPDPRGAPVRIPAGPLSLKGRLCRPDALARFDWEVTFVAKPAGRYTIVATDFRASLGGPEGPARLSIEVRDQADGRVVATALSE